MAGTVAGLAVGAAVGVTGGYLGKGSTTSQPWLPSKWDYTADVVVVGFGGAGASTAITASDAGSKVIILEKAPQGQEGGNTRVSGNLWFNPSPASEAIVYLNAMTDGYTIPQDIVSVWADEMGQNADWIKSLGGNPTLASPQSSFCSPEYPDLPGADCSATYFNGPGGWGGSRLWNLLESNVTQRNIQVLYGTPATDLIQNTDTKEILGVKALTGVSATPGTGLGYSGGTEVNVEASKAVVLTCGGFENNQQMIRDYLSRTQMAPDGTPYNTGDGISMGQAVGASLWHMDSQSGMGLGFRHPDSGVNLFVTPGGNAWIYVDGTGSRFVNESATSHHGYEYLNGVWVPMPTPVPAYTIMDSTSMPIDLGSMLGGMSWAVGVLKVSWSTGSVNELAKGWLSKGDTVSDLATAINVDPTALTTTVNDYNKYVAAGTDPDFGRPMSGMKQLVTAPFYALPQSPTILNTQGGPARNKDAQVLDTKGNAIPRLYSSGECGSLYAYRYNGGGNNGESMAFGRIAGRNAAAESPWT